MVLIFSTALKVGTGEDSSESPSNCNGIDSQPDNIISNNNKVFLYTSLRNLPIWASLRFWNAAFFHALQVCYPYCNMKLLCVFVMDELF